MFCIPSKSKTTPEHPETQKRPETHDKQVCVTHNTNMCGNAWYLELTETPDFMTVIKISCTWILLFVNLVPISLIISLELVKYFQAMFMSFDVNMYDLEQNAPMRA